MHTHVLYTQHTYTDTQAHTVTHSHSYHIHTHIHIVAHTQTCTSYEAHRAGPRGCCAETWGPCECQVSGLG